MHRETGIRDGTPCGCCPRAEGDGGSGRMKMSSEWCCLRAEGGCTWRCGAVIRGVFGRIFRTRGRVRCRWSANTRARRRWYIPASASGAATNASPETDRPHECATQPLFRTRCTHVHRTKFGHVNSCFEGTGNEGRISFGDNAKSQFLCRYPLDLVGNRTFASVGILGLLDVTLNSFFGADYSVFLPKGDKYAITIMKRS